MSVASRRDIPLNVLRGTLSLLQIPITLRTSMLNKAEPFIGSMEKYQNLEEFHHSALQPEWLERVSYYYDL